jgi:hypothetical protein
VGRPASVCAICGFVQFFKADALRADVSDQHAAHAILRHRCHLTPTMGYWG